jgi:hypothetical protein
MTTKLPTIPGFTEEDLSALAPEEVAALEAEHIAGSPEREANLRELAAGADDDTGGEGGDGKPAAADDTKPAEGAATGAEDPGDEPTETVFKSEAPSDAQAQIEAATAAKNAAKEEDKAALKKLHDGEIDFEEYDAIRAKADAAIETANETIADLKTALKIAQRDEAAAQQEIANAWGKEVGSLMAAAKTEGIDYKGNEALNKELNGLVRAFGQEATEKGMSDVGLKASKWALAQAHALMKIRHPELVKAAPAPAAGDKPAGAPAAAAPVNAAQRHNLTTLGHMPNADRALGDNDAIAKFGTLEGDDLERAMAGMSPAEVEKLMAGV